MKEGDILIENFEKLPDLHFIAGSRQSLDFELFNDDGSAFNASNATIIFTVGNGKNVFLKKKLTAVKGSEGVGNLISTELTSSETESWHGNYIAQLHIVFSEDNTIIPAEMQLVVEKKIGGINSDVAQNINECSGFH